ncbi:serine hydrolase domain-containing protein [Hymenobacter jejuensis]|uniref:Beta-lactamase family protein n=1 Tax=Hymenobacter jejuensis TaxID=2502781 RepID=A0A5B7ZUP7_9BACT|nr:serine hydrolase domain-containing protein [Hymenobacter jejuensis]QDA58851.1 beta-lactamase family protein [Hymenobacter jejuensis]
MKTCLAFLVLLLQALTASAQQTELAALLKKANVPGMQLVYTKDGKATAYTLGLRKAGSPQVLDAQTIFQAASLGKVMLAYTALRLHDKGLLDLDKPLLTYYRYPRLAQQADAEKITARMVLGHTSGLPNWAQNPLEAGWKTSALSLKYAPSDCWNYSGEGYVFLQKTLEHITGKSFEVLAQEEVFRPLHLAHSSYVWQASFNANATSGHNSTGQPTEIKRFAEPNAGFSLLTTAADYNAFLTAVMTGKGLKPATARLLTTPANAANRCSTPATATDPYIDWGCGLGLVMTSRGPALWHWGDNGDFKGFFLAFPDRRESVVFFTNSANGLTITDDVLRLFFGPGDYRAMQWLAEAK